MSTPEEIRPGRKQEILVFALAPSIVGVLTLAAWLLGRWQIGPVFFPAGLALLATVFGG